MKDYSLKIHLSLLKIIFTLDYSKRTLILILIKMFFAATSPPAKKTNGLCRWVTKRITINSLSNLSTLFSIPSSPPSQHLHSISSSQYGRWKERNHRTYRNHHLYRETIKKKAGQTTSLSLPFPIIDPLRTIPPYESTYSPTLLPILLAKKERQTSPLPLARLSSATASTTPRNHDQLDYTERKTPNRVSRFHEKCSVERKVFISLSVKDILMIYNKSVVNVCVWVYIYVYICIYWWKVSKE